MDPAPERRARKVDIRYVASTTLVVWVVLFLLSGTVVAILSLWKVVTYLLVALFFAVVLTPAVDSLQHRARMRRGVATLLVCLVAFASLAGLLYAFVRPLVDQGQKFADNLPEMIQDAEDGKGQIGELIEKYDLDQMYEDNQKAIEDQLSAAGGQGLTVLGTVFSGIIAAITVIVLTILLLLGGPDLSENVVALLPQRHRERVRRVSVDAAQAVSAYMFGNVVISIVAGVAAYIFLRIAGVPYAEVLALWVAFADLIPLVGATLGALPCIAVGFLQSVPVGIATIVFFVLYQQFENNVLQVTVMSKTVKINPLGVLVSVLIGVEIFGLLGALLAIPVAGVVQVIARDLWNERDGTFKDEPTIGVDEVPISEVEPPTASA
ncbi:MAG: family transporter [Ilumatobacteraceae bacterium]|nr:family transporter [Ilumatobacteraceae bacterium]